MPERTELEWTYEPTNYFEVPYRHSAIEYGLLVEDGHVLATLTTPTAPVSDHLEQRVKAMIDSIFLVRQLQTHRGYTLQGPRTYQHSAGRKDVSIRLVGVAALAIAGQADVVVRNAAGEVIADSRSDRIEADRALVDSVAPKVVHSQLLRRLLDSYSRSIADPGNELVHLYEVRDSLSAHFGGEQQARDTLQIAKTEWQRRVAIGGSIRVVRELRPRRNWRMRAPSCGNGFSRSRGPIVRLANTYQPSRRQVRRSSPSGGARKSKRRR